MEASNAAKPDRTSGADGKRARSARTRCGSVSVSANVQDTVGAMLVLRRVRQANGTFTFVLDKGRSAATTLCGAAFIEARAESPWSLLLEGTTSMLHRCAALPVGGGIHMDLSGVADLASRCELYCLTASRGIESIYVLHAADDVVVKFLSWVRPAAFAGIEPELLDYVESHVLTAPTTPYAGLGVGAHARVFCLRDHVLPRCQRWTVATEGRALCDSDSDSDSGSGSGSDLGSASSASSASLTASLVSYATLLISNRQLQSTIPPTPLSSINDLSATAGGANSRLTRRSSV
jgi:hypothetical protein